MNPHPTGVRVRVPPSAPMRLHVFGVQRRNVLPDCENSLKRWGLTCPQIISKVPAETDGKDER
jgi:hypothetical protein